MAFSGYAVQGQMPGYAAHPAPRAAQPVIHPAAGYPAYSTYPIQVRSGAVGNSAYQYPQQPHPQLPQQFSARRSTAAPASQIRSPNAGTRVRTAADAPMPPQEAIRLLKEGNARFVRGEPQATRTNAAMRQEAGGPGSGAPHGHLRVRGFPGAHRDRV
ncbi:unnamed protein product [Effrenium voratum]|uniref:Uncharacterized protein n=1 Tax=Effrenium voratum TaxID=2562239 RepID=A0AA36IMH9_9DINO|nr:unnamed protein product [Effrenium voratum]